MTEMTARPEMIAANDVSSPPRLHEVPRVTLMIRLTNLVAVGVPFLGVAAAIVMLWGWGFSWLHLWIMLGAYLLSAFGITIGYHRLFTHRSFETNRPMKFILAVLGSMAVEGPLTRWVATHRCHHQHSDDHDDPHSPHLHGSGVIGTIKGLWHAHMGWVFQPEVPGLSRYVSDLNNDPMLRWVSDMFLLWVAIGLAVPALVGGLVSMSWSGVLLGLIWGGLVRIFLVHHVTWSINSVCHVWGGRPYETDDQSRNNFIFGVLGLGEGWHNNHHAFPTSARHGLRWWQIDISYWVIRLMKLVGLASKVRVPQPQVVEARRQ